MLERQRQMLAGTSPPSPGIGASRGLIVEVACDDRQTQLSVQGSDTIADVRRQALAEMQVMASDPNKYIVIGADRQPDNDQRTVDDLLREGQALYFRLLPQVAFGAIRWELACA